MVGHKEGMEPDRRERSRHAGARRSLRAAVTTMKTILRMGCVLLLLLAATLLPFAPGRHDVLAAALSQVAQGLGYAGLLLAPLGAIWFLHGLRHRQDRTAADRIRRRYALTTIGVATLLGLLGAVVAAAHAGYSIGVASGAAVLVAARGAVRRSLVRTQMDIGPDSVTPLCWLLAPPLLLFAQWKVAPVATLRTVIVYSTSDSAP